MWTIKKKYLICFTGKPKEHKLHISYKGVFFSKKGKKRRKSLFGRRSDKLVFANKLKKFNIRSFSKGKLGETHVRREVEEELSPVAAQCYNLFYIVCVCVLYAFAKRK